MQATMLLPLTLTIMGLLSRAVSENNSVLHCRLKYNDFPETEFQRKSCIGCYDYMHPSNFKPGMKNMRLIIDLSMVSYLPDGFLFYL
jgi:hypothetical protein